MMSLEHPSKESSAMARARELNRTNEKRLTECIASITHDVEKSFEKIKIDGETTRKFMEKLKKSTGKSDVSIHPCGNEETQKLNVLINPAPKMFFGLVDYKKQKLRESSQRLTVPVISPACEGNPIPIRSVQPWTAATARAISRKKPPQIPQPTGRRRHSVESDENSSDNDETSPLSGVKKLAGKKRTKELVKRRISLPIIAEKLSAEDNFSNNTSGINNFSKTFVFCQGRRKSTM